MRLIDADTLLEKECCGRIAGDDVRNAPTIYAVPVVQCKNCKWFLKFHDMSKQIVCMCDRINGIPRRIKPNDFCSYGKRMER